MATTIAESGPEIEAPPSAGTFPPHRMTVDRYDRLVRAGVFGDKEPVFLWRGRLVEKMTKGPEHSYAFTTLNSRLVRIVPAGHNVRAEQPVVLDDDSAPEPDFSVARGSEEDYRARHPSAREIALVIEVADSSLAVDTGEVLSDYARAAIPVYWVVNVPGRRVEVYTRPTGPADRPTYRERRDFGPGDEVPVVLDGREVGRVAVREVLP